MLSVKWVEKNARSRVSSTSQFHIPLTRSSDFAIQDPRGKNGVTTHETVHSQATQNTC